MDENKQYVLNEVYKDAISKLTKEDFEMVRDRVVKYAIAKYSIVFKTQEELQPQQ